MGTIKISDVIKAKRKELNLTQEDLAIEFGVSKAAVSKWEKAESYPDITLLPSIAGYFRVTMDELFGYSLEKEAPQSIITRYNGSFYLEEIADHTLLDHLVIKSTNIHKRFRKDINDYDYMCYFEYISNDQDFIERLQKSMMDGRIEELCSRRFLNGVWFEDQLPNKHYVSKEKIWECRAGDTAYFKNMFNEWIEMGLATEDDLY